MAAKVPTPLDLASTASGPSRPCAGPDAVGLGLDRARHRGARSRAADVERAHRELRARLADRLRGDDAHGLAHVHARAAAEVTAVAGCADAVAGVAGERRAHLHFVDAMLLDPSDRIQI